MVSQQAFPIPKIILLSPIISQAILPNKNPPSLYSSGLAGFGVFKKRPVLKMVEVAGVEPASLNPLDATSTRLALCLEWPAVGQEHPHWLFASSFFPPKTRRNGEVFSCCLNGPTTYAGVGWRDRRGLRPRVPRSCYARRR